MTQMLLVVSEMVAQSESYGVLLDSTQAQAQPIHKYQELIVKG
jgi:hypothetical protein